METELKNTVQKANQLGQAVWLDYIRRGLIKSGELTQLITLGISGLTANPTILEKAIVGSTDYDEALSGLSRASKSALQIYETLVVDDIVATADLLRPIYNRTDGADGYACIEITPLVAFDTSKTVSEARRLFRVLSRPNVMVKVPATAEGIPAIRQLTAEGINVNVTLIFSLDYYDQVKEAYVSGLEELVRRGGDPAGVASVASFFLSRIDTAVDNLLEERLKQGETELAALPGKAAIASAKAAYRRFEDSFYGRHFDALKAKGARVQRLLWASTGTKNPAYSDLKYVESIIGRDTVNTMPLATIHAFLDHGHAETTLEQGLEEAEQTLKELGARGINLKEITDRLLADGIKAFDDSFEKLISGIASKIARLAVSKPAYPRTSLGRQASDVESSLDELRQNEVVRRIWRKDHTVWKPNPSEITDRLGWLTVTELMHERVVALETFAAEVKDAGFRHVVLLGMGGSSLGAEVLRQVFGSASGYPELLVLDSIIPAAVQAVSEAINPAHTLFLVSSKSGTTTEPIILFKYFRSLAEKAAGKGKAGQNFVAITDSGTPLAELARQEGFRHVFINPSDIGGRYSVLSYFGLVPGALIGADIRLLLERADGMREGCASCVPQQDNYGAWLGACIRRLAQNGRDKLTLITSPSVSSFGLWVEQLIAESTGKEGKGIVPVSGEPLVEPACYGNDRLFVYMRLRDDDNAATDAAVADIRSSGQPVVVLEMQDKYDLGAEFFRWEFATAIAGAVLGIHPFNQPNVQQAKDATENLLKEFTASGQLPSSASTGSVCGLLADSAEGKYLAVMAYLHQTSQTDEAFTELRRKVMERYRIATTLGYGPRFLHSTGQLHKGGPNSGLFLQLTTDHSADIAIPGEAYSFGVVADAQALGDFQALQANGRTVANVHVSPADGITLRRLTALIG